MRAGEINTHELVLDYGFGWIADDGCSGRYISGYDCPHADRCIGTYMDALANDGTGADVSMIADSYVPVHLGSRAKSNEITDEAIMFDVGVEIRVETAADTDI